MTWDWVPALALLATPIAGAIVYGWQKSVDRRNSHTKLQRETYVRLLQALNQQVMQGSLENLTNLNEARCNMALVAPDAVATSTSKFFQKFNADGNSEAELLGALGEMLIAMREDGFENTMLTPSELVSISPFVFKGD